MADRDPSDFLVAIPGFVSLETCAMARELVSEQAARVEADVALLAHSLLIGLREACHGEVLRRFGDRARYWDHAIVSVMPPGDSHVRHADNARRAGDAWEENHTPWRRFTSMLYLGGSFEGGELDFPSLGLTVRPRAGLLVAFPCGPAFEHEVPPVRGGHRWALAIWYTDDERWAMNRTWGSPR